MRWNCVSGGSSAHHQEHKTVHTASGIVKPILLPAAIVDEMERSTTNKMQRFLDLFISINCSTCWMRWNVVASHPRQQQAAVLV
jgi:hypothetical protein